MMEWIAISWVLKWFLDISEPLALVVMSREEYERLKAKYAKPKELEHHG